MATNKIIRGTTEAPVKTTFGSSSYVTYCRTGNVVTLEAYYKVSDLGTIAAWGSKTMLTLPEGYRPKMTVSVLAQTDRATSSGSVFTIASNGNVNVGARFNGITDTGDVVRGCLSFVV